MKTKLKLMGACSAVLTTAIVAACMTAVAPAVVTPAQAQDQPAQPEEPKADAPPKGEKTDKGLTFKVPYERGEGTLTFARQNELMRVDADVRIPYHGGDGGRDRGASFTLSLTVDGVHGRHLSYFPSPVWMPGGDGNMPPFRGEIAFAKGEAPRRIGEEPSFAAASSIAYWDHFTVTLFIDMRRVVVPGNTPGSQSDEWRAGLSAGSLAGMATFPAGLDAQNPANAPKNMLTFKLSELPELEELDEDPRERHTNREKAMYESMKGVFAKLQARDPGGVFKDLLKARTDYPEHLWSHYLTYLLSRQAGAQGIEGIDTDYLPHLKSYLDACPGQSRTHKDYLEALLQAGQDAEAFSHFKIIDESPLCTGRAETAAFMRMEWCEAIIAWGYTKEAAEILGKLKADEALAKNDALRVNLKMAMAALAERQGDSTAAADVYKDLLTSERKFLTPQQLGSIQQLQQFQLQAKEQWVDELKYQAEDAKKKNPRLIVETDKGKIVFELFEDDAPNTVKSLVSLTQKKFYDGLNFHRVEPSFVAQGGCPKGDGTGSPGYRTKFEDNKRKHFRGTVAMARSMDPNSQGSQFYICVSNGPNVINLSDNKYLVVGRVVEGMDVADKLRVGDKIKSIRAENLREHEYKPETLPEAK